jgi:L-seryl-tRNA(Ser) seleniumtransferase
VSDPGVRRVLNATGAILDPQLGGAPLAAAAREAVLEASGYAEVDDPAPLAASLAGAAAGHVVTSASAGLVLAVQALATGGEVVVARADQPWLDDGSRIDALVSAAGARLRDVGTSTTVDLDDVRGAVGEDTRLLLSVAAPPAPPAARPPLSELAAIAREHDVPLVHLTGGGPLRPTGTALDLGGAVATALAAGADLVLATGDGALGGPPCGLLLGSAALVARCVDASLAPAVGLDALRRAALLATLQRHAAQDPALDLPVLAMGHADVDHLEARARFVAAELGGDAEPEPTQARLTGSTSPRGSAEQPSWSVRVPSPDPALLRSRLAASVPAVHARSDRTAVLLDLLTVPPALDAELVRTVANALGGGTSAAEDLHDRLDLDGAVER